MLLCGGAHASPKPYLYCTTRSPECLKKFMSCPSPRFFSLSPTETSCYVLFAYPAMQFVDCILIEGKGGGGEKGKGEGREKSSSINYHNIG